MEFVRYQSLKRYGTEEVDGIEIGTTYVFPKADGSNGCVWLRDGVVRAGSRNRELTLDNDNQGFYEYILTLENIKKYLEKYPNHRLYGEWMVPHTLKTYRDDVWRRFFVFDVCVDRVNERGEGVLEYIPYEIYSMWLDEFGIDYIPPLAIVRNGEYENFTGLLENNNFLIKDGHGVGEGIVIKNYSFYNRFGRQTWAKIVTSEFKERHHKTMGDPVLENKMVEESIVEKYVTSAFVEKEFAKIVNEKGGWRPEYTPILLNTVFYELVNEETWNFVKEFGRPKVDFKTLNAMTIQKVKSIKGDIF